MKAEGTHDIRTYIDRRQATMARWVSLWPILEVCVREEMGNKGGGWIRFTRW